mmetsp:Transcript_10768/g.30546  ORF Transcript_10768/g.30546 Transcript_10768/m.30546 type:complete len:109 (+) Transcript_10768:359-685(+)
MSQPSSSVVVEAQSSAAPLNSTGHSDRVTLRLVPRRKKKGVRWTSETVDNEGLGRKNSKKCCIFHRRRAFGDWSDSEDSDQECNCPEPTDDGSKGPGDPESSMGSVEA